MGRSLPRTAAHPKEAAIAARRSAISFFVVGTNYRRAPIAARDALARHLVSEATRRARAGLETIVLATCNRCEVYGISEGGSHARKILSVLAAGPGCPPRTSFYAQLGDDAVLHLVRVAAGLDSLAWGEPQVALQVRAAARTARAAGDAGPLLESLFRAALAAARSVRESAGVTGAPASLSGAAVRRLRAAFPDSVPTVLLVGVGKIGRLVAKQIGGWAQLVVADRNHGKAEDIARSARGTVASFERAFTMLGDVDAAIVATAAAEPIVTADAVRAARNPGSPILHIIDLSVPRNVDPAVAGVPRVELLDVDGLVPWVEGPKDPAGVEVAEALASREATRLGAWLRSRQVDATLAALRRAVDRVRQEEVRAALARLQEATDRERLVLEKLAERIVNRVLHIPTERLRKRAAGGDAGEYERVVRDLFGLRGPP